MTSSRRRDGRWTLPFAVVFMLAACERPEAGLLDNASRYLDARGVPEADISVGVLFNRDEGAVCFILGDLKELYFANAVPLTLRREIERRALATSYNYEGMTALEFDERGREVSRLSLHWRHPRLSVWSLSARDDADACFGPADKVHVKRWRDTFGITYPVGENAHD